MKKSSIFAIVIGALLILVGAAWAGFNPEKVWDATRDISRVEYTDVQKSFVVSDLKNIDVDVSNVKVSVIADANAKEISVSYADSKYTNYALSQSGGTLKMIENNRQNVDQFMCIFRCMYSGKPIEIRVPATTKLDYKIETSNSQISVSGRMQTGELRVKSSNGGVSVANVQSSGGINLESSNAKIEISDVSSPNIYTKTSNGGAIAKNVATPKITMKTSNAKIDIDRLKSNDIDLDSSNGGITAKIIGDIDNYDVKFKTSNGSIIVDGSKVGDDYEIDKGRPNRATMSTSNASLNVQFVQ